EIVYQRLRLISLGSDGLFTIKKADFDAAIQIEATMRSARTIAEQFMSASELATRDIRKAINTANQQTSRSMDVTLQAMMGFILISALVALGTFLYVSRTVLRRLVKLRRSMVAHAEGTKDIIDTSGGDEITDMARSLQYLVDTLHSRELGLTEAKEQAEHASTAKTRFLAAASHDLRQPLQALNLFVYALEGKEKDEEKREIIHLIRNSLDSLKELLNTLLDISKLEAGVVNANMKDFAAGPMLERIKSELTAVAWASDLELRTVVSSVIVHSDPSLLETTLRNLVDNAIKYTERGRVLLGCRRRGDRLRIEVWDTGPGIPKDQQQLIFQDFYQIDNEARKRTHGLGLGLSIVKRMTALLGCEMGCDSQPGKGSVFWVDVPTSLTEAQPSRREVPRIDTSTLPHGDAHIVLVEDDEQVLMGLQSLLESQGYTTLTFQKTDREHVANTFAVKKRMPDLIIADYRLEAKATGSEVINMIRGILEKDIPAIIITGDTAPERLREAKRSGFPILHKPVRPEELMIAVRHALSHMPSDRPLTDAPKQRIL
ncbi:MAG TPA: hybrid sensor histidine kinase/response regulator, partial [Magnetovibrio sp.]